MGYRLGPRLCRPNPPDFIGSAFVTTGMGRFETLPWGGEIIRLLRRPNGPAIVLGRLFAAAGSKALARVLQILDPCMFSWYCFFAFLPSGDPLQDPAIIETVCGQKRGWIMNIQADKQAKPADETLFFIPKQGESKKPWKVMIADDEPEIHQVTKMVLGDYVFEDRPLQFLSAYSGNQTQELIQQHPDTAILLLDVVMETDDAGLQVAKYIRQDIKNQFVRIILRTGQPGKAPERDVILNYDINEYKHKTELTVQKLFTTITTALRAYRDLRIIEKNRAGLEHIIHASPRLFEHQSIKEFAKGVLTQLTSILKLDETAVYIQSRFCEHTGKEDFIVLAATGDYKDRVDQCISELFPQDIIQILLQAVKENKSLFADDVFVGYFAAKSGTKNLLYLKNCRQLSVIDRDLIEVFVNNVAVAFENILLNKEIEDTQKEMMLTLGEVVESRSRDVGKHSQRVAMFCHRLAQLAGLSEPEADLVRLVSPLHDAGKIAIPDSILLKPSKLSPEEFERIKPHTTIGYDIFKKSERATIQAAALVALQHHECWDGSGYPHGLKGEQIHIFARITSLADVFDSLSHARIYKSKWEMDAIIQFIKDQKGRRFDPLLVDIFLNHLDEFIAINNAYPD